MKYRKCAAAIIGMAAIGALADWIPEDGHKMHFPQMPNPTGWDVDITANWIADDWMCIQTGPVRDIHFWMSWRGDLSSPLLGITARIYSDVPVGPNNPNPFSHPGDPLWERTFDPTEFKIGPTGLGWQGWYDPVAPEVLPDDHGQFVLINMASIEDAFWQEEGNVYWLALHVYPEDPGAKAGWKTSLDYWNDNAVAGVGGDPGWIPLSDPLNPLEPLHMAFVITPEPNSVILLILGVAAFGFRRRGGRPGFHGKRV